MIRQALFCSCSSRFPCVVLMATDQAGDAYISFGRINVLFTLASSCRGVHSILGRRSRDNLYVADHEVTDVFAP